MKYGSITTGIIADGLVFNMDAANRASTIPSTSTTTTFNTLDTSITGTIVTDATWTNSTLSPSFDFDGSDGYINSPFSLLNSITNFTINFWGSRETSTTFFGIGSKASATSRMFLAWYNGDNKIYWNCKNGSNQDAATYTMIDSGDTGWHYYTGIFEGGNNQKLYFDGNLKNTVDSSIPSTAYSTMGDNLDIGLVDNTSYSNGQISNIHIYNRALSANEVLHNYNALKGRFT